MNHYTINKRAIVLQIGMADVLLWKLSEKTAVLIDTGTVDEPELISFLEENNLNVRAILQTHLHIDHIANNRTIVSRYGADVYACINELPDAEFSGIQFEYPIKTNHPNEDILIDGFRFQTILTPGHTMGHQLIITPDGICNIGDALMSLGRIKTAKIPFMRNVNESLFSMEAIRETDFSVYLAAHRGIIDRKELERTIDENIEIELRLYRLLKRLVTEPISQSALERKFMLAAGLTSERVMTFRFMHITCEARIKELIAAGELTLDGDLIIPIS